jgi:hypothetical protein
MSGQRDNDYESDYMYDAETLVDDVYEKEVYEEEEDEKADVDYEDDIEEVENQLTEKDLFGDISDMSDTENTEDEEYGNSNTQCALPKTRVQIDRTEYVSDLSMNDTKVFETLDPDEKKYLPLNYIVSSLMEWKFVQEACASGFRSVANLSRVSNKTIREIANISQHTLDKKTAMIPKLNQAFIDYAAQRGI